MSVEAAIVLLFRCQMVGLGFVGATSWVGFTVRSVQLVAQGFVCRLRHGMAGEQLAGGGARQSRLHLQLRLLVLHNHQQRLCLLQSLLCSL